MAIMITDECINCGACEPECPNNAIYEGGAEWKYQDGTSLSGSITTPNGEVLDANASQTPVAWMCTTLPTINAPNVWDFMMNHNVLPFVR